MKSGIGAISGIFSPSRIRSESAPIVRAASKPESGGGVQVSAEGAGGAVQAAGGMALFTLFLIANSRPQKRPHRTV